MANYSLIVGSKFQPLSYQEILAPVQSATEAHIKSQDELAMLEASSEALRNRALAEADQDWAKRYNMYTNALNEASESLATQGLNPDVRNKLLNARRDYFSSVQPALQALAQQQAITDSQWKQDPAKRMVYGELPTIQQLIANPELKPVGFSGQEVYQSALTSGKSASTKKVADIIKKSPVLQGYIEQWKTVGYKQGDIDKFVALNPEIKKLIDTVKQEHGGFDGLTKSGKERMEAEIVKGLYDGAIYNQDRKLEFNKYEAELREAKRKQDETEIIPTPKANVVQRTALYGNPDYDYKERVAEENRAKFFEKNNNIIEIIGYLADKAEKENIKNIQNIPDGILSSKEFKNFMKDMKGYVGSDALTYGNMKKAYAHYLEYYAPSGSEATPTIYDMMRGREMVSDYAKGETQNAVRTALKNNTSKSYNHTWENGELKEKTGFFGGKEEVNIDKLKDFKVVDNALKGQIYIESTDDSGETVRFPLDKAVNETVVYALKQNNKKRHEILKLANEGKLAAYFNKKYKTNLTEEEALYMMRNDWGNLVDEYREILADLFPYNKHEANKNKSVTR